MADTGPAQASSLQHQLAKARVEVSASKPSSRKALKAAAMVTPITISAAADVAADAAAEPASAATTKKSKRKRDESVVTPIGTGAALLANGPSPILQHPSQPRGLKAVGWGDDEEDADPREAVTAAADVPAAAEPVSKSKRKRQKAQQEAEVRAAELKRMEVSLECNCNLHNVVLRAASRATSCGYHNHSWG